MAPSGNFLFLLVPTGHFCFIIGIVLNTQFGAANRGFYTIIADEINTFNTIIGESKECSWTMGIRWTREREESQ